MRKNISLFKLSPIWLSLALFGCTHTPTSSSQSLTSTQEMQVLQKYGFLKSSSEFISIKIAGMPWRIVDKSFENKKTHVILMPNNQDPSHWKESIEIIAATYSLWPEINANKVFEWEVLTAKQECNQVQSKIITKNKKFVSYEIIVAKCKPRRSKAQLLQVGKIFNGTEAIHMVRYFAQIEKVPASEINLMSGIIQSARLTKEKK